MLAHVHIGPRRKHYLDGIATSAAFNLRLKANPKRRSSMKPCNRVEMIVVRNKALGFENQGAVHLDFAVDIVRSVILVRLVVRATSSQRQQSSFWLIILGDWTFRGYVAGVGARNIPNLG
ncbi:hypothetical protein FALBO_15335 [Fusarium albosuccineum]|uniref:Uncharacterized protein n=1 Tax=Fusarium albosuccineum TaxID=1237068 RepID=A0A8H4NZB7_9HYPO|nr:hypothetical protein FALBO_15335 [Fusarium albosuccineum]